MSNRFEQATIVEPIDPFESGEFNRFDTPPRTTLVDHFGFEQAVDRLGERVVVAVADAADRWLDAGLKLALAAADREVLHAAITVVHEAALPHWAAVTQCLFERVQYEVRPC